LVLHGPVEATWVRFGSAAAAASTVVDAARKYRTPSSWRCWIPRGTSNPMYWKAVLFTASEGFTDSSFWLMKWNGVVLEDSKSSPSIESMQPLVQ
jgi:hypothetical protein